MFHEMYIMAGKMRFSGARKSVLRKASSGERCAPSKFVHLVALPCTLRCNRSPHRVSRLAPNEICYGKMKQCNDI